MLNSIKKYLKRAKEESTKEYSINVDGNESFTSGSKKQPGLWTGIDLDGTLAYYDRTSPFDEIGDPVPAMLTLVKELINNGIRVKIFTARAQDPEQKPIIREWLKVNGLPELEITNIKDYNMQWLLDDRCIQVERNTGRLIFKD
ncbi:MAG: hypothetical protein HOG03_18985 [Desulfobacula sp.]|uniref:hypothetical protein n=1 Tax=Desulfobacula sp. TaxID=2593537 RepID=UPI001D851AF5|nr:hypothetical protein [Desulfobacula sp.]MBT3806656.1 hypothetical protein [Desulfobacula sp.]MBT4505944.1 hypothetical protein [Desulfobacula sp.]MBT5971024.1 hypothetical protein [Desulfobacula sp.]MBT6339196.1 hypothetical protein [Desulfobacula sp.]